MTLDKYDKIIIFTSGISIISGFISGYLTKTFIILSEPVIAQIHIYKCNCYNHKNKKPSRSVETQSKQVNSEEFIEFDHNPPQSPSKSN
jgi:hypothetical protein